MVKKLTRVFTPTKQEYAPPKKNFYRRAQRLRGGAAVGGGGGGAGAPSDQQAVPGGRLTLQSLTPVLIADVLSVTDVFYTPYLHDRIPIFSGVTWLMKEFTELTNDTTAAAPDSGPLVGVADSNYDLFVWENAGVMTLTRGPVWTSDILRSGGTALVRVNGILLNAVAITNGPAIQRGTYVGTIRLGTGAFLFWKLGGKAVGGSSGYFNVWNMYNRIDVEAQSRESTVSWTYAGGIFLWRAINNALNNRVSYVVGLAEDPIEANFMANVSQGVPYIGIGLDSVTARTGSSMFRTNVLGAAVGHAQGTAEVNIIGFHFVQAIEFNNHAAIAAVFFGDIGIPLIAQNGLFFEGRF